MSAARFWFRFGNVVLETAEDMSRIGKKPIVVPASVSVEFSAECVSVSGEFGSLRWRLPSAGISACLDGNFVRVSRHDESRESRALHGLSRALICNMIVGVSSRFEKRLELQGVGYQASMTPGKLSLSVGFSHPVVLVVPTGVECVLVDSTHLLIRGADRADVGQFAANIRRVRPPEPYKGKGIRYGNEFVRRKSGKAFGSK